MSDRDSELTIERSVAPLRALLDPSDAEEILILSFTANLGFFTRAAAGRARSRGARVSLVSDLSQTNFDPDAVRGAGSDWLDGRIWCRGAFHPKLIVIGTSDSTTVLIGSGNATPDGWVDNAELWVRIDATSESSPNTVIALAEWLEELPGVVETSPGVDTALIRSAKILRRYPATYEGPQLVHNLDEPIHSAMPQGPVNELFVSTPFHDPSSRTLASLCDHLRPVRLTVMVQDSFRYDGPALDELVARWNGQVVSNAERRYHHGKLFEWAGLNGRYALVGSPNCTGAALGKSARDHGGNCEMGVICRINGPTLAPAQGETLDRSKVLGHPYVPPTEGSRHRPLLVAALIEEAGTRIVLRTRSPQELNVEVYERSTWIDTGRRIPEGAREQFLTGWWPDRGQAIRIPDPDGSATTPVAATQFSRLERREAVRNDFGGSGGEFVDNPKFISALKLALARFRVGQAQALEGGRNHGTSRAEPNPEAELPGWQERVERMRTEGGERFMWFTLPHLARLAGHWVPPNTSHKEIAEQDEPDEPDLDDQAERDRAAQRAEYRVRRITDLRRWCERNFELPTIDAEELAARKRLRELGEDPDSVCSEIDVCILAVTLAADALMAWADPDDEAEVLRAALRPLTRRLADENLGPDAASAAALGLWVLNRLADDSPHPDIIRTWIRGLGPSLDAVVSRLEEKSLSARCESLRTEEQPYPPNPAEVCDLALRLSSPDPLVRAKEALSLDTPAVLSGRTFTLTDRLPGDGVARLLRLALRIDLAVPLALRADTDRAGQVTVAWDGLNLVILIGGDHPRGTLYALRSGLTVGINPDNGRPSSRDQVATWYGTNPPHDTASGLLERVRWND